MSKKNKQDKSAKEPQISVEVNSIELSEVQENLVLETAQSNEALLVEAQKELEALKTFLKERAAVYTEVISQWKENKRKPLKRFLTAVKLIEIVEEDFHNFKKLFNSVK